MRAWTRAVAITAFGTHELEVKLGLARENYEFGFGPTAVGRLTDRPQGHVQLAAANEPDGRSTGLGNRTSGAA